MNPHDQWSKDFKSSVYTVSPRPLKRVYKKQIFLITENLQKTEKEERKKHTVISARLLILANTLYLTISPSKLREVDLNHQPRVYETRELPDCSTPR